MDSSFDPQKSTSLPQLDDSEPPAGSDRRTFMMRSAMAAAVLSLGGEVNALGAQTLGGEANAQSPDTPAGKPLGDNDVDPNLQVIKNPKGPVMTLVDEFYKVGP